MELWKAGDALMGLLGRCGIRPEREPRYPLINDEHLDACPINEDDPAVCRCAELMSLEADMRADEFYEE